MNPSAVKLLLLLLISCTLSLLTHALQQPQPVVVAQNVSESCRPRERDALLAFKQGITNDTINLLASWQPAAGRDCCRWRGVTCDPRTGHVVKLDLSRTGRTPALVGQISPSLLSLEYLEYLDLSTNMLSNHSGVPEFLGSMNNLRHLDLSNISFSGTIPRLLGNLSKLEYLDLSHTSLSGIVPPQLGNLSSLRYLNLSFMQGAYSTDVSWLTQLQLLQYIDMSNVTLSTIVDFPLVANMIPSLEHIILVDCSLPSASQSLTHLNLSRLQVLDLSQNYFGHPIASCWFWSVTSIKTLSLVSTYLHGPFPDALGGMTSLRNLNFDKNGNAATMNVDLRNLCDLETISLDGSLSSGNITELVEKLPQCNSSKLFLLSSAGNNMTGVLPDVIENFTRLTLIDLSNNSISGAIPPGIGRLTGLEELHLNSNRLTGQIPLLPRSLRALDISVNFLSGHWPREFAAPNLTIFIICTNRITGQVPRSLCELQNVLFFDLSSNLYYGEFPHCSQSQMPKLLFLLLSKNGFSGKFPSWLQSFSTLVFLDLSWNKLHGTLPAWTGESVNLRFLQLSHNKFSGDIAMNFTNLRQLQYLNLAANNISGLIPPSLSSLPEMTLKHPAGPNDFGSHDIYVSGRPIDILLLVTKHEQLQYGVYGVVDMVGIDLSLNHLTGGIPNEIAYLDRLSNLNLSWNHLSGKIPEKMGSMKSMESLDLSRNNLSGEIPQSLADLTYLSYLELSYNNLTGMVPSGRQLDTLYTEIPSMYDGNIGLCGPPLQKNCSGYNAPLENGNQKTSDEKDGDILFLEIGLASGFMAGLWVVFCTLLFKNLWRIAYFRLSDKLYDQLYVFLGIT